MKRGASSGVKQRAEGVRAGNPVHAGPSKSLFAILFPEAREAA